MNVLRTLLTIAVVSALAAAPSAAQTVDDKPVPEGLVDDGGCLTFPTGGKLCRPGENWEWRVTGSGPFQCYVLVQSDGQLRIICRHAVGANINDAFMEGILSGVTKAGKRQGITIREPAYERVDVPFEGTYRFTVRSTLPGGEKFKRVGYVLPSGHVVMVSFPEGEEPEALKRIAASYEAHVDQPDASESGGEDSSK